MIKTKKLLGVFLSVCLMLSALSVMLITPSVSAQSNSAPVSNLTYDFTDTSAFSAGSLPEQKKGEVIKVDAEAKSSGSNVTNLAIGDLAIVSDPTNNLGLGENAQVLKLGKALNGNTSNMVDVASFINKASHASSETFVTYPVTKMSVDAFLPNAYATRGGGLAFSKSASAVTYDTVNSCFKSSVNFVIMALAADSTYGVNLAVSSQGYKSVYITANETGVSSVKITDFARPGNYSYGYGAKPTDKNVNGTCTNIGTLGALAIDARGNSLDDTLALVLDDYFKRKTSISNAERWVNIEVTETTGSDSKKYAQVDVTLNFSDYADLRKSNPNLPEELKLRLPNSDHTLIGSNNAEFSMLGSLSGDKSVSATAVKKVSFDYDISSYSSELAKKFKEELDTAYASLTADIIKQDDLASINEHLANYDALDENAKSALESDEELQFKLSTLNEAKAALENGAYMFDAFEGNLNWQVEGKISNFSAQIVTNGDNVDCSDDLTETNTYSEAAAADAGDSDGKAFWGINTDSANEYNKALWLRKSFNGYNMDPAGSGNRQKWPSVLYTLKDGVLPNGAKIEKITGKMYYSQNHYKKAIGILYNYTDKFKWNTISASGEKITNLYRTAVNKGELDKWGLKNDSGSTVSLETLKKNQWVDFILDYDYEKGRYDLTLTGLNTSDSTESFTMNTPACELLEKVGICHAFQTAQSIDNIAITLAKEKDYKPAVLGAKILKKKTENGDQNLRIDFDFSNVIANGADKNITEYGVILQAGTQTKETLISVNNKRTVLSHKISSVSDIPSLYTVTITNSAENSGKRVSALAYIKDSNGNYYYSENNSDVVTDGVAQKSVMGVMKAWYADMETNQSEKLNAAAQRYVVGESPEGIIDAAAALDKASRYANGIVTTTDSEYAECKTILSRIFYNFYNTNS